LSVRPVPPPSVEAEVVQASSQTSERLAPQPQARSGSSVSNQSPLPPNGLTWREANAVLDLYRERWLPSFACVPISRGITAQDLLSERPFVFRAVMLIAAPLPVPRLEKMKRNVLAFLGHRLLVGNQRTLDLLQGLMIVLIW
jgi:hypothetical protein